MKEIFLIHFECGIGSLEPAFNKATKPVRLIDRHEGEIKIAFIFDLTMI